MWAPISHRTLFWTIAIFGPWTLLLAVVRMPWAGPGMGIHLLLPGLAVWWVCYVVDGGARPDELVRSWVRYGVECRPAPRRRRLKSTIRAVR